MSVRPQCQQLWGGAYVPIDWTAARLAHPQVLANQQRAVHVDPACAAPPRLPSQGGTLRLMMAFMCLMCIGVMGTAIVLLATHPMVPELARSHERNLQEEVVIAGAVAGAHTGAEAGGRVGRRSTLLRRMAGLRLEGQGVGLRQTSALFPSWHNANGALDLDTTLADLARAVSELARETGRDDTS